MADTTTAPAAPPPPPANGDESPQPSKSTLAGWLPTVRVTLLSIVLALLVGALLIIVSNDEVISALPYFFSYPMDTVRAAASAVADSYSALVEGSFGSGDAIAATDRKVLLVASGAMSHTFWPLRQIRDHESADPSHIFTPEARDADLGIAAGRKKGHLFVRGQNVAVVPEDEMVESLVRWADLIMEEGVDGALGRAESGAAEAAEADRVALLEEQGDDANASGVKVDLIRKTIADH